MTRAPYRSDPEEWDEEGPRPAELAWPEVYVSDNPVVAVLLGPDGEPIRTFLEREPIGFRIRP